MLTFEKKGIENTTTTLQLALEEATKRDLDICMATTMGASAKQMMEMAKLANFKNKIVVVSHAYGFRTPGENTLSDELRKDQEFKKFKAEEYRPKDINKTASENYQTSEFSNNSSSKPKQEKNIIQKLIQNFIMKILM